MNASLSAYKTSTFPYTKRLDATEAAKLANDRPLAWMLTAGMRELWALL